MVCARVSTRTQLMCLPDLIWRLLGGGVVGESSGVGVSLTRRLGERLLRKKASGLWEIVMLCGRFEISDERNGIGVVDRRVRVVLNLTPPTGVGDAR